jgi:hypothetical protein
MNPTPTADVRTAARALELTRARVLELTHKLTHKLAHELELVHELADARARELTRARVLELTHKLAHELELARERAHESAHELELALKLVHVRTRERAQKLADELVDRAHESAHDQALADRGKSTAVVPAAGRRASRVAVRVARYAVWVVPVGHRDRYDEEFRGELTEIAQKRGVWGQLGYAARILGRGVLLRRALRGMPPESPAQARLR